MGHFGSNQLARTAFEKFGGAWLACLLVMSRGNFGQAFSVEHVRIASVCGIVGAVVAVALVVQMDRTYDSPARQATISALVTFIGDVFSRVSQLSPQWFEPLVTALISASIAVAYWYARRLLRGYFAAYRKNGPTAQDWESPKP
jgi:uncharacterized membrane protein YeaQ/YmgE (transglycosylase-associated protein family)